MTDQALRVLGVHGVKNYQPGLSPQAAAGRLAGWWHRAVCRGLCLPAGGQAPVSLEVAYYAHRLHDAVAQGDEDPGDLAPATQELIVAWARLCGAPQETAQGWLGAPARAAADWVAGRFGLDTRPARILASVFFGEVQAYFTDAGRRAAAAADVAAAIDRAAPGMIIAHSLGSVVAYETLWAHPHPPVELLLTIGSPLAMPDIIIDRLQPHPPPRGRPPGVARWINIADPGDFIAVPKGGVGASFEHVTADLTDAIGAFSFHQVTSYLRCGATAGVLASYLPPLR